MAKLKPTAFAAGEEICYMDLNAELAADAVVKSLSFGRHPDFPDMLVLTKIRIALPAKRLIVAPDTPQNIVGYPFSLTRIPVENTEGIPTFVQAMADGTLEVEHELPGSGKIPNTPG